MTFARKIQRANALRSDSLKTELILSEGISSPKLVNENDTCLIHGVEIEDMIASDHDIVFDRIKAFVEGHTHDDIRTSLRPFIESEIRFRFKKPLVDLGKNLNDISPCINALKDSEHITADVEIQLSSIINSLNTPMHEIGDDSIENTRALAKRILNVVYNDL
jgi:hypothetical protein